MKRAILSLLISITALVLAWLVATGGITGLILAIFVVPMTVLVAASAGVPALRLFHMRKWNAWWQCVLAGMLCSTLGALILEWQQIFVGRALIEGRRTAVLIWLGAAAGWLTWWFGIRRNPEFVDSQRGTSRVAGWIGSWLVTFGVGASVILFYAVDVDYFDGRVSIDAPTNQFAGALPVTLLRTGELISAQAPHYLPVRPGCHVTVVHRKLRWTGTSSYFVWNYNDFILSAENIKDKEWMAKVPLRCDL